MLRAVLILLTLPGSYGRICRGQVFVYLLQAWLSGFVGKSLVNIILESEFPYRHKDFSEFGEILPWHTNRILIIGTPHFRENTVSQAAALRQVL